MRSLLAGILVILAAPPALAADLQGPARVIDGDTIEVVGQRVRLYGIDAPEWRQLCIKDGWEWPCGEAAADALRALVHAWEVSCEGKDLDRYGRLVARCRAGHEDIGEWMVRQGWALAYRRYSREYVGQEEAVEAEDAGIWSSAFMAPWRWRKMMRDAE